MGAIAGSGRRPDLARLEETINLLTSLNLLARLVTVDEVAILE
ncbi:MAG TPA: hypothetical protein VK630_08310 [Reyranella sp.]|nr:hypothetical protein [Reyranella sp.]